MNHLHPIKKEKIMEDLVKSWDKEIEWRNPPSPKGRVIIENNIREIINRTIRACQEELHKTSNGFIVEGELSKLKLKYL